MYGTMVVLGKFDPGTSSHYYQQLMELLNFDGTTMNGITAKNQWMVLELPLRMEFTEM